MEINHACSDVFAHFDTMKPRYLSGVFTMKKIEDSATITEFRDDVEILFFLSNPNERNEINLRRYFNKCFDFSLEFLLVSLV